jgi:adenylosuccinate synthase
MAFTADILVGLSQGDEGKGCVTNALLKSGIYTHCIKSNGGHNSGHTIMHEGKKVVTHAVPSGVVQGVKSIIGPGCVLHPDLLEKEIHELESVGIEVRKNLFIDNRVHIITDKHLQEDGSDTKIGTTRKGNGPAYRDKYSRTGQRYDEVINSHAIPAPLSRLGVGCIDVYDEFFNGIEDVHALFEGGQGFYLDIDWGDYPYVTSSHCTAAGAMLNGIPHQSIRKVYGISKAYDTYVGAKEFEPQEEIFKQIRKVGNEWGATTGRPRQVNWLNVDNLIKAIRVNGVTHLITNKVDILKDVGTWQVISGGEIVKLSNEDEYKTFVTRKVVQSCESVQSIVFSSTPDGI